MKKLLLTAFLCVAWVANAFALVDVSSKVQVIRGTPTFNYVTNQTSVSLSVKNISSENLQTPIRVTLDSISPIAIACANPDGTDSIGKPFFLLTFGAATEIKPGETSYAKQILFANPNKLRFNFSTKSYISIPENTVASFVSALSFGNIDAALKEFDDDAKIQYGPTIINNSSKLYQFASNFNNRSLIYLSSTMAKYEIMVQEGGIERLYDIYLYKNAQGEWKIFMM